MVPLIYFEFYIMNRKINLFVKLVLITVHIKKSALVPNAKMFLISYFFPVLHYFILKRIRENLTSFLFLFILHMAVFNCIYFYINH